MLEGHLYPLGEKRSSYLNQQQLLGARKGLSWALPGMDLLGRWGGCLAKLLCCVAACAPSLHVLCCLGPAPLPPHLMKHPRAFPSPLPCPGGISQEGQSVLA